MRSSSAAAVRLGRLGRWWLDQSVRAKGMIVVAVPLIALVGVASASLALQYKERQVPAAVAEGDSPGERAAAVAMTEVMAALARVHSTVSAGAPAATRTAALVSGKTAMDSLRSQIAGLTRGPAAVTAAGRANITAMESAIDTVSIAGLALGMLAGVSGVVLFASGISRRIDRAAANADRLGEGQPLVPVPVPGARDELGQLARSLVHTERLLASRTTELITARDEAVRASQAKNAFLSSTSHELRTPLNAVLGFTQLLQLSDLSGEDRDAVERILAAGQHLLALINELIDIARIESGGFSLSVEPVSVQPVIAESCQLMGPLAADRSITISQHLPWPGLAVKADRQRLRQILVNLLSNAVKYNRAGGAVTITCQPSGPGQPAPGAGLRRGHARAPHRRQRPWRRDNLHPYPAPDTGRDRGHGRRPGRGGPGPAGRA